MRTHSASVGRRIFIFFPTQPITKRDGVVPRNVSRGDLVLLSSPVPTDEMLVIR